VTHHRTTLVVGCGNDLRSDDRAGREVAARIEALDLPGVTVRSVTQLVPELALDVALADVVVVVDADVTVEVATIAQVALPTEESSPHGLTHHVTLASLLLLAATAGRVPGAVFVVSMPVVELGIGERMSQVTELGVERAVDLIEQLVLARAGRTTP
jgi:hydrogenase maturation protease